GVMRDMIGGEVRLQRESVRERFLRFLDSTKQSQRHGHEAPGTGMIGMTCRSRSAHRNRIFVPFQSKKRHVTHNGRIDREKWIKRADAAGLFQALEAPFRLAAARESIGEPRLAKRTV